MDEIAIPSDEIHVWRVDLTATDPKGRWARRRILSRYLGEKEARIELRLGPHGKPALAGSPPPLHFNLSHSGDLALVAVTGELEVGIDVQLHGTRAASFYAEWVRKEAVAKCLGGGLGRPIPRTPMSVSSFDAGEGYAAAVAVVGPNQLPLHRFQLAAS